MTLRYSASFHYHDNLQSTGDSDGPYLVSASNPRISVIVIGYRMSRQLANTLYSLSADYQRNIHPDDYEVVVVENSSDDNFDPSVLQQWGGNFRYTLRDEPSHTPVPAINFAFGQCRGPIIGLMIDGARMVSPRVLEYALMAEAISERAITIVPGYHLGSQEQHLSWGHDEQSEQVLLESINWKNNGYRLFDISTFSGGNANGFLQPLMECNCLFASAACFREIGYADPRFTLKGGGSINLHMFRQLGMLPGTKLFLTPGEGSFHQYHGGVTTMNFQERDAELLSHKEQLHSLWPEGFQALRREPMLLGAVSQQALLFLAKSVRLAENRYERLLNTRQSFWPDDDAFDLTRRHPDTPDQVT